jgi:circadian clock protein KaiC
MLGGKGYYRGSSVLISGMAGTGKSSLAAAFALAACERGERTLYFAFEESPTQIMRNMKSIGLNLQRHVDSGRLTFHAVRPTFYGLEMHLVTIHDLVKEFRPSAVVLDPITNLTTIGSGSEVKSMLTRLIDFLKSEQITTVFTSLLHGGSAIDQSDVGVSSLMDAWLFLRNIESGGERNRGLYVLKSRGMAHSNQVREFLITSRGLNLIEPYLGLNEVLTGSARAAQESRERVDALLCEQDGQRRYRELERKRKDVETQISKLREELGALEDEMTLDQKLGRMRTDVRTKARSRLASLRGSSGASASKDKQ